MARLPTGFHWINSRDKKQGARGPDNRRLSRQEAENRGAREIGLKNAYEYTKLGKTAGRKGATDEGRAGKNYRSALKRAQEAAHRRGERFDKGKFDATAAALSKNRADTDAFQTALQQYRYQTGAQDRPDAGTGSP